MVWKSTQLINQCVFGRHQESVQEIPEVQTNSLDEQVVVPKICHDCCWCFLVFVMCVGVFLLFVQIANIQIIYRSRRLYVKTFAQVGPHDI